MKERAKINRDGSTNVGRGFHGCHDMNQVDDKLN